MRSSIWLYRLYDVAQELDLALSEQILSARNPVSRLTLRRVPQKSMQFKNRPVSVELPESRVRLGEFVFSAAVTARLYDWGVVTIAFRLSLPEDYSFEDVCRCSLVLTDAGNSEALEELFRSHLGDIIEAIRPALISQGERFWLSEDFTVYYFEEWDKSWDPVPLLTGEISPVSPQQRGETLRHSFSYGDDLTILTWDAALVYDPAASPDIPDLLEFANAQLLELRYYDAFLDGELNRMYDAIEEASRAQGYFRLGRYRRILRQLLEISVDIAEITERIQIALKVTDDIFYARVYTVAQNVLRTREWLEGLQRKHSLIERSYAMLSDEVVTHRSYLLEMAIVALFILEIIIGFAGK